MAKAHAGEELLASRTNYSAQWWTPVPTNGAPAWEIFAAGRRTGEVILSKRNELGLLSNFAPTPFTFHGKELRQPRRFLADDEVSEGTNDLRARFPDSPGLTPETRFRSLPPLKQNALAT
ncbi:MAG: hypothetical protein WDN00_01085 [Limisphaerales bacterium]